MWTAAVWATAVWQALYQQQQQQQQPQPWGATPPTRSADPVILPLRLLMAGMALGTLNTVIALVVNGRFYSGALSRYGFPFLAMVATALLIAGAALLARKTQAGHQLAMVTAGLYGVALVRAVVTPGR